MESEDASCYAYTALSTIPIENLSSSIKEEFINQDAYTLPHLQATSQHIVRLVKHLKDEQRTIIHQKHQQIQSKK